MELRRGDSPGVDRTGRSLCRSKSACPASCPRRACRPGLISWISIRPPTRRHGNFFPTGGGRRKMDVWTALPRDGIRNLSHGRTVFLWRPGIHFMPVLAWRQDWKPCFKNANLTGTVAAGGGLPARGVSRYIGSDDPEAGTTGHPPLIFSDILSHSELTPKGRKEGSGQTYYSEAKSSMEVIGEVMFGYFTRKIPPSSKIYACLLTGAPCPIFAVPSLTRKPIMIGMRSRLIFVRQVPIFGTG